MSAEAIGAVPRPRPAASRRRGQLVRPVAGVLADGTAFYAPIGEMVVDGALVICHLCGRPLRSVTAHLRVHGWTPDAYREAFGLERGQPLEGPDTRKLRAAAFASRLVFEPAVREGSAAGRDRARAGHLARDAAAAARGRQFSQQRRKKTLRALAAIPPEVIAQANKERARRHLTRVAALVAQSHGYPDIGSFVMDQVAGGASLAAISRRAGLDKDWLSRHLPDIDPAAAAAARQRRTGRWDARWLPAVNQLGFPDVASYLHERHIVQHWTVNAIATEVGLAHLAVASALRRHGLARTAHAAKRHAAGQRAAQVAAGLGFDSIAAYVSARRAASWTWQAMSAESGQPQSWLRRHQRDLARPIRLPLGVAIAWDPLHLDHLRECPMRLSARNQIPARVTKITAGEAIANVELDANGVRLVASITVEAVRDLGLAEGSEVTAVIKASEVILATGS